MSDRYLRHIPSGTLYIWQASYAQRSDFEEVEAAPTVEDAPKPKAKAKPKAIEPVEPAETNDAALSADASRGLP
jgi:hypothetical protein